MGTRPGRPKKSARLGGVNRAQLASPPAAPAVLGEGAEGLAWLAELDAARMEVAEEIERAGAAVLPLPELRRALGIFVPPVERELRAAAEAERLRGAPLGAPSERVALRDALAVASNDPAWREPGAAGRPTTPLTAFVDTLQASPWGFSLAAALAAAAALGVDGATAAGDVPGRVKQGLRRRRTA